MIKYYEYIFLLFIITSTSLVKCKNILILEELPSPSHHLWLSHITTILASVKGYNLTILTDLAPDKYIQHENITYLHLDLINDALNNVQDFTVIQNAWTQLKWIYDFTLAACEAAVISKGWKQLQEYPNDFKFDLVIHDNAAGTCLLAFLAKFNYPPMIAITASRDPAIPSMSIVNTVTTPTTSTGFTFKTTKTSTTSTFFDRFENYLYFLLDDFFRKQYLIPKLDIILREQAKLRLPSVHDLRKLTELVMFNYNPIIDEPAQFPPNVIGIGGLQIKPSKPLSQDLQDIFDIPSKGVILFSLGTNVPIESLDRSTIISLLNGFRLIPEYTILCKMQLNELEYSDELIPKNVIQRKWLPQNDILANNRTKVFITHSGLLSTQESVWHGVPVLGLPVFLDQFMNAEFMVKKGLGEQLFWDDLTDKTLSEKINKILNNYLNYKNKMDIASNLFHDEPQKPIERAIWWIEWVIRNPNSEKIAFNIGAKHQFLYIELQSIDVLFTLFTICLIIILVGIWMVVLLVNRIKSLIGLNGDDVINAKYQKVKRK